MRDKEMTCIYLSGKISGLPDLNKPKFLAAENLVFRMARESGLTVSVINPHLLPSDHDGKWQDYMRECIKAISACDAVYVLDDWKKSKGAIVEVFMAKVLGIELRRVEDFESFNPSYLYLLTKLLFKL